MNTDLFKTVRERVTALEAAEKYGVEIKNNKARCIWHDDRNPSLSFKDSRCRCFACGNGGSAIDVAMKLHGLPAKAAAEKLSADFGLGAHAGDGRHEIRPREPTTRDERNAVKEWFDKRWNDGCEVTRRAQAILDTYTDRDTAFNDPRFLYAMRARCKAAIILYKLAGISEREKISLYRNEVLKYEE